MQVTQGSLCKCWSGHAQHVALADGEACYAEPMAKRQVAAPRKNPLSQRHLPSFSSSAMTGRTSESHGSQSAGDEQVQEDTWEQVLPASSSKSTPLSSSTPSQQQDSGENGLSQTSNETSGTPGRGKDFVSSTKDALQAQLASRAAFVARTNAQLAQGSGSAGSPGAPQQGGAGSAEVQEMRRRRMLAMRMHELRPLCRELGVPMYGKKAELVERLLASSKGTAA